MKSLFVFLAGAFAAFVLVAPSLIPDFLPLVGFIDEAIATTILIACARHFGFDIAHFFGRSRETPSDKHQPPPLKIEE